MLAQSPCSASWLPLSQVCGHSLSPCVSLLVQKIWRVERNFGVQENRSRELCQSLDCLSFPQTFPVEVTQAEKASEPKTPTLFGGLEFIVNNLLLKGNICFGQTVMRFKPQVEGGLHSNK